MIAPPLTSNPYGDHQSRESLVVGYMPARTVAADGGIDESFARRDVCDALHTNSGNGNKAPILVFGGNNAAGPIDIATAVNAHGGPHGRLDFESETFVCDHYAGGSFAADTQSRPVTGSADRSRATPLVTVRTNNTGANGQAVNGIKDLRQKFGVRRLTPLECEKLQGFSPGWTDVPYRGKPAADGNRYKALGNSMCVNVMAWIGQRIALVDAIPLEASRAT